MLHMVSFFDVFIRFFGGSVSDVSTSVEMHSVLVAF
jgi:hypothetical protein